MANTNTFTMEADSGLHRGLELEAATYWPASRVKDVLQERLAAQAVPCCASRHHLTLRRTGTGWVVAVKCQDDQGRVLHPPTRGALRAVRQ